MKSEFKPRPQSKRLQTATKPPSRYVNTQQAKSTFQQAKAQQAKENYQRAIELYIRATVYDPNFYQAYCNIGSCYRALKQYSESRRYYQKSISIKKDDAISHYNLGNVLRLMGDYESSINHYSFVIGLKEQGGQDIGSLYLNSLVNLGICYKNKHLFDKACQCCQRAYKIDGNDETCLFNYAMSIVGSIRGLDQQIFHEVVKQKATKAIEIFKKYDDLKKGNQMLSFQLVRMSLIGDKSNENIDKAKQQLNQMLAASHCTLADEIRSQLAYCEKLSASIVTQPIKPAIKEEKKEQKQNIYDVASGEAKQQTKREKITEEEGIRMIEQGLQEQVRERIKELDKKDQTRHVLEIAIELSLIEESPQHLRNAQKIYQKHFILIGKTVEIPMDQISIEGHKVIGQLLALQGNFQKSISHFEYINSKISSQREKSKIHSFLGNDYEAMGDMNKALEEYKIALETQPDNYELNYNLGCCFFEQVSYEEAKTCFQRALALVEKDSSLPMETKQLYTADCLIVLASCIGQLSVKKSTSYDIFYRAWMTLQQVLSSSSRSRQLEQRKILKFYLEWTDVLEQKMNEVCNNKRCEQYRRTKQLLLEAYLCLLDMRGCPDPDAIRNNAATIYYEDKLYVNALIHFNQIQAQENVPYNNVALTYLHLHEHFMASQQIMKTAEENNELDQIEVFNKELICWIYGFSKSQNQALVDQFNNQSDEAMIYRLEYAKILTDVITTRISQADNANDLSEVNQILQTSAQSEFLLQFMEEAERLKLRALISTLKESRKRLKDQVDPNLLAMALKESTNPEQQLNQIIKRCIQSPQLSQSVVEVLINLFVFRNRTHLPTIRTALHNQALVKSQNIALNLDRRVTVTPQMTSNQFSAAEVKNLDNLLSHLLSWESEVECKLVTLMKAIERCYYKSNIRRPLQYEYTFPKHRNWNEDNLTFFKITNIILSLFPSPTFSLKATTLKGMKAQIFQQLEHELSKHLKQKNSLKLSFNQKLAPILMYCYFQNKNDCLMFLKELQKESSSKGAIEIGRETQEVNVLVSGLVRIVCQWEVSNPTFNLIRSINENLLPIDAQSVITLEEDLYILKESSQECRQLIQQIPIFKK